MATNKTPIFSKKNQSKEYTQGQANGYSDGQKWYDSVGLGAVWFVIVLLVMFSILFVYMGYKNLTTEDGIKISGTVSDLRTDGDCKITYLHPVTKLETYTIANVKKNSCIKGQTILLEYNTKDDVASPYVKNATAGKIYLVMAAMFAIVALLMYVYRYSSLVQGLTVFASIFN